MIATLGYLLAAAVIGGVVWLIAALRVSTKKRALPVQRRDEIRPR